MPEQPDTTQAELRSLVESADPAVRQLLPGYVANRHADLDQLQAGLENEDSVVLRRIGHNLKGSGAAYGLPPVSRLGADMEQAALQKRFDELRGLIETLRELVLALDAVVNETTDSIDR